MRKGIRDMGMIDEKGRIFGKINAIDFLVIIFLVSLLPALYFVYKIADKSRGLQIGEKWIAANVRFADLIPEVAIAMKEGDFERDTLSKRAIARIEHIKKKELPYRISPEYPTFRDHLKREITASMLLQCQVKDGFLYFKNQNVRLGGLISFKTAAYEAIGMILNFETDEKKQEATAEIYPYSQKILVESEKIFPEIVKVMKEGDAEKDIDGKTIITLKKIEINPSELKARMLFEARCDIIGGTIFLKGTQLRLGDAMEFIADKYRLYGIVLGFGDDAVRTFEEK